MVGLHISQGLYQNSIRCFEDECFQIDIRLASEIAKKNSNECASINNTFKEYVEKCTDLANMDVRNGKISDEIRFIIDAIQMQLLHNPDVEAIIKQIYANRLLELQTELAKKVN